MARFAVYLFGQLLKVFLTGIYIESRALKLAKKYLQNIQRLSAILIHHAKASLPANFVFFNSFEFVILGKQDQH